MRLRLLAVTTLATAAVLAVAAPASAAPGPHHRHHHHRGCGGVYQVHGDSYGILNGTQVYAPIDLGLDLSHNALGLLGSASAYDLRHDNRYGC